MKFEQLKEEYDSSNELNEASTAQLKDSLTKLQSLLNDRVMMNIDVLNFKSQKELVKHVNVCIKILDKMDF